MTALRLAFLAKVLILWLSCYALPRLRRGEPRSVPPELALSFVAIVLIWPWLIPWGYLPASDDVQTS